jgi:hypothetical protein
MKNYKTHSICLMFRIYSSPSIYLFSCLYSYEKEEAFHEKL